MTTHTGNRGVTHHRLVLVASVAAFALAALTGVGGWQIGLHTRSTHPLASVVQQVTTTEQARAPVSDVPAASSAIVPAARAEPMRLILVGSAEQSTEVQRGLDEADAIRVGDGLPPLDATVQVETADTDAQAMLQAVAAENQLRATLGLPEIGITDLRSTGPRE